MDLLFLRPDTWRLWTRLFLSTKTAHSRAAVLRRTRAAARRAAETRNPAHSRCESARSSLHPTRAPLDIRARARLPGAADIPGKTAVARSCTSSRAMRSWASRASAGLENATFGIGTPSFCAISRTASGKRNVLDLLDEAENVSRIPAAKAVKKLARSVDGERRRLLAMKRTQPGKVLRPRLPQFDVVAHDADDVRLLLERLLEVVGRGHERSR